MKYPSSREYKMMLHPDHFAGQEAARDASVAAFWQRLKDDLSTDAIRFSKRPTPAALRDILFLDTATYQLFDECDLMLRLRRRQQTSDPWDATLKFRHGDRLQAAPQLFKPRHAYVFDTAPFKFEEDVKAVVTPHGLSCWLLFSRSATASIFDQQDFFEVSDLKRIYARMPATVLDIAQQPLTTVRDLRIVEQVYDGGRIALSGLRAEAAIILWWRKEDRATPIAAEFSFRFALGKGMVEAPAAASAWDLLKALAAVPAVDPSGPTKTAIVYGSGRI